MIYCDRWVETKLPLQITLIGGKFAWLKIPQHAVWNVRCYPVNNIFTHKHWQSQTGLITKWRQIQPIYIRFKKKLLCNFCTIILTFPGVSLLHGIGWKMKDKEGGKQRLVKNYKAKGVGSLQSTWWSPACLAVSVGGQLLLGQLSPTAPAPHQQPKGATESQAEPDMENTHAELFPFSVINTYRE